MAAMNYEMARAAAEKLIQAGRAKGLTREALISQIIAESRAAGGAPQPATGAGLMIAPQPVVLSPGVRAVEGVPFTAPKSTAPAQPQAEAMPAQGVAPRPASRPSRYQPELDRVMTNLGVAKKAMSDAVASGKKPNVADQIRLDAMQETADRLGALARAEGSPDAEIPEEMRAAFEGRQARLARREELLAEAKARSPWEALLAGGAALTQRRPGERGTEAVTRSLQAGIQQYLRSRREGEEGIESIAEARDQALMDRYNMREQAVANARQRALEMMGIGDTARERAVANLRLPTQIETEQAGAELAKLNLKNAPEAFKTEQDVRKATANYYNNFAGRRGTDPNKPMTENQRLTKIQQLQRDLRKYRAQLGGAYMSGQKQAIEVNINDIMRQLAELQGATPAATASSADEATHVYVPGRGPVRIR